MRPSSSEPAHAGELSGDRCGRIAEIARLGVGKVRDDAHHLHARNGREEVVDRAHLDGQEAQTVHARVHLDVNLHLTQLETLENVDLPHGVDDRLDVKVLKRLDVRFIEEALQKQHALVPARAARAFGVAQVDGRKAVRIGEGLDGILKTVAVGIGLDDRPEGAIADTLTKAGKIVLQRLNINFSVYGTGHSNTLLS